MIGDAFEVSSHDQRVQKIAMAAGELSQGGAVFFARARLRSNL